MSMIRHTFLLLTLLALCACDAPKLYKNIILSEENDFKEEELPLRGYRGILFTMTKEEVIQKFGCQQYELTVGCPFFDGEKEDMVWLTFNESGRMIVMKKDMGYFREADASQMIDRLTKKYTLAYEPSSGVLNTYNIGLKDTLSYAFGNGQVAYQIGRSFNKKNQLVNIYFFPPDVGATFLESIRR